MADRTCPVYNVYDGDEAHAQFAENRTLHVGATYTPSAHIPSHTSGYTLEMILVYFPSQQGYRNYTTGSFTMPDEDITLIYYWESPTPPPTPTTGPYIWNGSEWKPATPYVWDGSAWKPATANVWDASAWKS